MKFTKILAFMAFSLFASIGFAQNGKFITDQVVDNNIALGSAKSVNPKDLLIVDENPGALTIAFTYVNGDTENWTFGSSADYNAVLDKFLTGERRLGNDFFYTSVYGTNAHRRISYHNVRKTSCAVTQGGTFYTVTITLRTGGAPIVSNGYSMSQCGNFNY